MQISAEKLPNKAKTANFNGLFSLNIFQNPMLFSITSPQLVTPNLWGLMNIQKAKSSYRGVWSSKFLLRKEGFYSEGIG